MPTIHSVHYCFVDLNRKTILTLIQCAAIQFGHFLDDDDIGFGGTDHFFYVAYKVLAIKSCLLFLVLFIAILSLE